MLADPRVDPSAGNNQAINAAVRYDKLEVVKVLLAHPNVDPAASSNWLIRSATHSGFIMMMRLLLADSRVDPGAISAKDIKDLSIENKTEIVNLLLGHPKVALLTKDMNATTPIPKYLLHLPLDQLLKELSKHQLMTSNETVPHHNLHTAKAALTSSLLVVSTGEAS